MSNNTMDFLEKVNTMLSGAVNNVVNNMVDKNVNKDLLDVPFTFTSEDAISPSIVRNEYLILRVLKMEGDVAHTGIRLGLPGQSYVVCFYGPNIVDSPVTMHSKFGGIELKAKVKSQLKPGDELGMLSIFVKNRIGMCNDITPKKEEGLPSPKRLRTSEPDKDDGA